MNDEGSEMRDEKDSNRRQTRPHETLEVYRTAHDLAIQVHSITLKLPKHE